jgi:hypothetical protein
MFADSIFVHKFFPLLYLISSVIVSPVTLLRCQAVSAAPDAASTGQTQVQAQALVQQALAAELQAVQDTGHPMRYLLRKSSPRLTTTKEIFESRDGDVARLLSIDDKPLSSADEQQDEFRLDGLVSDPGRQRHRKQQEDDDTGRALRILSALPAAFLYEYAGSSDTPSGKPSEWIEKFTFRPNPAFTPPNLETQILAEMAGAIWIDASQRRVTHLEGHLEKDVDFGWGILGRLNKGGWISIDQADVGGGQWRTVRFQMVMSGRVVFKNRSFDTVEEQTHYTPVPAGLDYHQAIQMLRADGEGGSPIAAGSDAKRP